MKPFIVGNFRVLYVKPFILNNSCTYLFTKLYTVTGLYSVNQENVRMAVCFFLFISQKPSLLSLFCRTPRV